MLRALSSTGLNLLIVGLVVLVGAIGWGLNEFRRPGPLAEPVIVDLPRGAGLSRVASELKARGAIRNEALFRIGARYMNQATALRFGEYAIPAGASMADILAILVSGRSILYRITIPEGLTSFQVVERLRELDFLTGEVAEIPPEGSLAPDTYSVSRRTERSAILREMAAAQRRIVAAAWEGRQPGLPLASPEEMLVLASIVEKETGVAEERPVVASVFVNRLRRGMRLETDPTVIYGLTEGKAVLDRALTRSDLERRTRYNTYRIDGLPPTPIANPGRAAIEAVANPAATEFIFFVADGTGGHAFAVTKREHDENVARWRAIERERTEAPVQP